MSDFIITLKDDPKAQVIYDQLKKDGVSFKDIDKGYEAWSGGKSHIVGKADGAIQPQEVYDYVLSNYDKYRDLFANTTKLDFPWALPAEENYSPAVKKYVQWLESIVTDIKKELQKKGIKKNNPQFPKLFAAAIYTRFGGGVGQSRDMLIEAGFKSFVEKLEKEQKESPVGNVDCQKYLPLTTQIEKGCKADDFFFFSTFYQALPFAGMKSGFAACSGTDPGFGPILIPAAIGKEGEMLLPGKEVGGCIPMSFPRIAIGLWHLSVARMLFSDLSLDEQFEDSIKNALLLMPESDSAHSVYGAWLYQWPKKDFKAAEDELKLALSIEPDGYYAHFHMGVILKRQKHPSKAIEEFQKVISSLAYEELKDEAYGLKGEAQAESGKVTEAIEGLIEAIKHNPSFVFARRSLATVYWNNGQRAEAVKELEEALDLFSKDTSSLHDLSNFYLIMGKLDKALELAEKLKEIDPNWVETHILLGMIHHEMGKYEDAIKDYNTALKIDPTNNDARVKLAGTYFNIGQDDDVDELIEQIIASPTTDAILREAYVVRGLVLQKSGKNDEALAYYEKAMQLGTKDPLPYLNVSYLYFEKGKIEKTKELLLEAIELDPDNDMAYNNLGFVYFTQEQYDDALKYFNKAIKFNPDNPYPHVGRSLIYMENGKYDDAINALTTAIEQGIDNAVIRFYLVNSYLNIGEVEEALTNLKKAAELDPNDPDVYYALVKVLSATGDELKADEALEKLKTLVPNSAMLFTAEAYQSFYMKLFVAAKNSAKKAIGKDEKTSEAYEILGVIAGNEGNLDEAIAQSEKAIKYNDSSYIAYNILGIAYAEKGKLKKAKEALEKAIAILPAFKEAQNNLSLVEKLIKNPKSKIKFLPLPLPPLPPSPGSWKPPWPPEFKGTPILQW